MKVALAPDYLVERGGAEKVLAALHGIFPEAPIYTAVYNPASTLEVFRRADVRVSFLQRLTAHPKRYRALLPLYPLAFRSFELWPYDLVISSASGFAQGGRRGKGAPAGRAAAAYGAGGALETVVDGVTGVTFPEQTAESLLAALDVFDCLSFDPYALVQHARQFDTARFTSRVREIVAEEM